MRGSLWIVLTLVACGDPAPVMVDAPIMQNTDAPTCQPQSAVGSFYRRTPNPRIAAGAHTFSGSNVDTEIDDPDLLWDGATWHLYYSSPNGSFTSAGAPLIRHASSSDLATWTFTDTPALTAGLEPTVAKTPDGHYLMIYSDGTTLKAATATTADAAFTGSTTVLAPADIYPNGTGAKLADPELVIVGSAYHLWFSSQDCATAPCTHRGIGHAISTNGTQWTLDTAPVPSLLRASADPSSGGITPSVIYDDEHCRWEMWLSNDAASDTSGQTAKLDNTAGSWHATSTNGTSWTINYTQLRDLVWDNTAANEDLGMRAGADVASKNGGRYLLFTGYSKENVPANSTLPTSGSPTAGVMTLNLATRDAP